MSEPTALERAVADLLDLTAALPATEVDPALRAALTNLEVTLAGHDPLAEATTAELEAEVLHRRHPELAARELELLARLELELLPPAERLERERRYPVSPPKGYRAHDPNRPPAEEP